MSVADLTVEEALRTYVKLFRAGKAIVARLEPPPPPQD